ncbi:NAD(P)/FAD-dependent oxidoreductase [Desulfuribacillus alkaliarsenatis]|uniref:FAD-dependent oxidoreductase n=1 Tax=Desulfuribacillus alkaliarsenatis TaxID=766136 RepID=A0A1E5G1V1_9FIRM|nr:NAD(P)/FAD-dependent oxidoreductase [Desulfuribacillus alkaliarsenatis]OEF96806.1 FAD-dependent oxidoreductase [Desulfuribacillus alkaliarsenatis]
MSQSKNYDVIIVGAGPAGIFSAYEIVKLKPEAKVLLIEKGKDINKRHCPMIAKDIACVNCKPHCSIMTGWGGAGAYSDGKLTLTADYGGWLDEYLDTKQEVMKYIKYVDEVYLQFGATEKTYGSYDEKVAEIERMAATADLKLIPAEIRHLGTENNLLLLSKIRDYLRDKIDLKSLTTVKEIITEDNKATGIILENGEVYTAPYVIVAPGRVGSDWFRSECSRLGLALTNNQVDIGVRVEVPASSMEHITRHIYESKLVYYGKKFDDPIRTFCMNPYGDVVVENTDGIMTVNGHSYATKRSKNTNFALLVSNKFTEPFKEPIAYGKYIATLANMLGGTVIVQRFGDLKRGRRSTKERMARGLVQPTLTSATPGDLSLVFPYRQLTNIIEMLEALDKVAPGVGSEHTLLYGVEVKFYSSRPELSKKLETNIDNMFAIGDGAGVTRGLAQAGVSGVVVAREIVKRMG